MNPSSIETAPQAPRLRRLTRNTRGIAALEFALIAPLFIFMFLSMVAIYTKGTAAREIQQTSASLSDIVARYIYVDDDRVEALGASAEALLQSSPGITDVRVAVASFYNPPGNYQYDYTVLWSKTYKGASQLTDDDIRGLLRDIPIVRRSGQGHAGDSMVLLVIEADYEPPYGFPGVTEARTFTRRAWAYPRYTQRIEFVEEEQT